jgi:predicted DNA-binding transcriptional regulator YafY
MNRFDRINAILIHLQSKKIVKAQDIADRFEISLRTVYRDIRSLEEAGVPLVGEAGVGYSVMEGYRLPPVMFTAEEAMTFITAEKLVEKFTDISTRKSYTSAMLKIKSVLRGTEKDMIESIEENIEIVRKYDPIPAQSDNSLPILLRSIADKKVTQIKYTTFHSQETADRTIEPIGIFHENGFWYTIAFCQLRNAYRQFRTDRILEIRLTEHTFLREHASLKEYLEQLPEKQKNLHKIVIRIDRIVVHYLQRQKYYYGFVSETLIGEQIEMTFLSDSLTGFAHWFLMMGEHGQIIEPASLKDKVREIAQTVLNNL